MDTIEKMKEKLKRIPEIVERNKKKALLKKNILENFKTVFKSMLAINRRN